MAITKKHLKDFCCLGEGTLQCRYLDQDVDEANNVVYLCKKLSPYKKIIDSELIDYLNMTKRTGQDPYSQKVPLGDNCSGFIALKTKQQGYDLKS
jgi:hypothetical protein